MNFKSALIALLLGLAASAASAQLVAINGIDLDPGPGTIPARDGYGGIYEINGTGFDGGTYWWMCAEPVPGTTGAGPGEGLIAQALSLTDAWDQQNQERLNDYTANPGFYTTALPRQVQIMEYVLDKYLPWHLMGTSERFAEQSGVAANFGTNDAFYNAFFTIQNIITNLYGAPAKTDFSDILAGDASPFQFYAGNATGNLAAIAARQALFDTIVADIDGLSNAFIDSYQVQGTYLIANSNYSTANNGLAPDDATRNWQDALIIVAPVPEPSGALLIACTGLVVMLRRFRRSPLAR